MRGWRHERAGDHRHRPRGHQPASEAEGSVESGGADRPVLELRAVDSIRLGERILRDHVDRLLRVDVVFPAKNG